MRAFIGSDGHLFFEDTDLQFCKSCFSLHSSKLCYFDYPFQMIYQKKEKVENNNEAPSKRKQMQLFHVKHITATFIKLFFT